MGLSIHTSIEGEAYSKMPSHPLSPNLSNQFVFRLFSASAGQPFWSLKALKKQLMAWEREGILQLGCLLRECFFVFPEMVDLQSYPINSLPAISPSIAETSISTLLVRLLLFCEGLIRLWHGHMLLLFQPPESS